MPSIISANSGFFCSAAVNCLSSSEITRHGVCATAVALRGESLIAAISPKISPTFTAPSGLPLAESADLALEQQVHLVALEQDAARLLVLGEEHGAGATASSLPADSKNARAIAGM